MSKVLKQSSQPSGEEAARGTSTHQKRKERKKTIFPLTHMLSTVHLHILAQPLQVRLR